MEETPENGEAAFGGGGLRLVGLMSGGISFGGRVGKIKLGCAVAAD